jgi:hypothetical protein
MSYFKGAGCGTLFGIDEPAFALTVTRKSRSRHIRHRAVTLCQCRSGEIRGILTRPSKADGRLPAILYSHCHGGRYEIGADELLDRASRRDRGARFAFARKPGS